MNELGVIKLPGCTCRVQVAASGIVSGYAPCPLHNAAPDLLEACEELLQMCERGIYWARKEARIIDKAEKAISKAKEGNDGNSSSHVKCFRN